MRTVLAIDTAANSGWCLVDANGKYVDSGECSPFVYEAELVCAKALSSTRLALLLLEKPSHGNRSQLVGMGAARGGWQAAWGKAGGKVTKAGMRDVFPATWRSKLFGDTAKNPTRERLTAQIFSKKGDVGPDEAAAICIALYATKFQAEQPRKRVRRAG